MSVHVKGHPIHPMLVAFPIGLYVTSLIFDCVNIAGGNFGWYAAAYYNLVFGILFTIPAALTGIADWLEIRDPEAKQLGIYHMSANISATVLFFISWLIRTAYAPGPTVMSGPLHGGAHAISFVVQFLGVSFLAVGGWLGGELVYRRRVGVGIEVDESVPRPAFGRRGTAPDAAGSGDTPSPAPI